jgi:hypothetical protein
MLVLILACGGAATAGPLIWGVNPAASGAELVNIDPLTGTINTSFDLPDSMIGANDTGIGLAGWSDTLFYINGDSDPGTLYFIDPTDGTVIDTSSLSGGWYVDGLGYWSGSGSAYIYTSGCSVNDTHRYLASGSGPSFYWSDIYDPQAMAGDNGGKVFSYGQNGTGGEWGIWGIDPLSSSAPLTFFADSPSETVVGMAYDGTYLYLSDLDGYLYTLDNSGELVNTLDLGYTLYALASSEGTPTPQPVPEPATISMILCSIMGLALMRRKFKR